MKYPVCPPMIKPKFLLFLTFATASFLCHGQEIKITPIPYPLDQFLTNIVGMCQDEEGFIWLADNYNGLIKYDGNLKKYYKTDPNNSNSLFSNRLETITAGKGGIIWIGSAQNGLDRFDPSSETFTHYQHDTNEPSPYPSFPSPSMSFPLCSSRILRASIKRDLVF